MSSSPRNVLIFANCQGDALHRVISVIYPKSKCQYFANYVVAKKYAADLAPDFKDALLSADVVIYQHLGEDWGAYTTHRHGVLDNKAIVPGIFSYCADHVTLISFPYIYNDALWPVFQEGNKWKNIECLAPFARAGLGIDVLVELYQASAIDFDYANRMSRSLEIFRRRDSGCTLRAWSYCAINIFRDRVFSTQNHPSASVLAHLAAQLVDILEPIPGSYMVWLPSLCEEVACSAMPGSYPIEHTAARSYCLRSDYCAGEHLLQATSEHWSKVVASAYSSILVTEGCQWERI